MLKDIIPWIGIGLGLISAYYWYKASIAKITDDNSIHRPGVEALYDDPDAPGKKIRVFASAMEQSRLNKIAAVYTALSLLSQALASLVA